MRNGSCAGRTRRSHYAFLIASVLAVTSVVRADAAQNTNLTEPLTSRPRCAVPSTPRKDARKIVDAAAIGSSVLIALQDQRTARTSDGPPRMDQLSGTACDVERISIDGKSILVSAEVNSPPRTGTRILFKVEGAEEWFRLTDASVAYTVGAMLGNMPRSARYSHALVYRTPKAATVIELYRGEPSYALVRERALRAFAGRLESGPTVSVLVGP